MHKYIYLELILNVVMYVKYLRKVRNVVLCLCQKSAALFFAKRVLCDSEDMLPLYILIYFNGLIVMVMRERTQYHGLEALETRPLATFLS